jgi:hypothetical protein
MDVDLTIRYSDDRLCEIVVYRPGEKTPLYRIVGRREHLAASIDEAMREARHLYAALPCPGLKGTRPFSRTQAPR